MNRSAILAYAVLAMALPAWCASSPPYTTGKQATVLVFTTTDCPIANAMLPELMKLQREFASQGVAFTLVHVDPETTTAGAREHAAAYSVTIPFILDPHHRLVKQLNATRTPEAFVLMPDGRTAYHGRINDLYHAPGQRRRSPSTNDLRDAIASIIAGQPVAAPSQPAVGCVIADFAK